MAKTTPAQYIRQVRQELSKVTWPSRKEAIISTVMVFIMVLLASLFFLAVDGILSWAVELLFSVRG
ncbi:preprotein translocase subunit SecE [Phaeovibrio sulfidiphilus]|uniref:Protein translocase subunit SecE n=1 Tax=Phaeovibrio sulfidiphilus TaxID=1220600 RepID=A0A8J6YN06_9PROT|nr:preprotein translocase subunit SecE [Phaeovibrio sulfidiphilus]MBE1236311.1 preprotein translocase subunit SecE [Phaeovibrio sulfidiphilus]